MIEITFTRPLTTYNNSEPIISALFSRARAKPLRSPRLAKFKNSFKFDRKRCNTSRFSRPFCLLHLLENDSFLLVFSKAAILSLTLFTSDSQSCVVGFLIKQLFFSGLLDMKWSLSNGLVEYLLITLRSGYFLYMPFMLSSAPLE